MRKTTLGLLALTLGLSLACSKLDGLAGKDEKKDDADASGQTAGANDPATEQKPADEAKDKDGLGLAAFCKYEAADGGKGCFTCTPRDIPAIKCVDVKAGFDPATACEHDLDHMSCDVGAAAKFNWDFDEESKAEILYSKLPLLVFAAKALLAGKLTDTPQIKDLIYGSLDALMKYKKELFTGGNWEPMLDDIQALVKKVKPDIAEADLATCREGIKTAISALETKRKGGSVADADALTMIEGFIKSLPPDIVGSYVANLDMGTLIGNLKNSGNDDFITQMLQQMGGDQSIEEVIGALEGG